MIIKYRPSYTQCFFLFSVVRQVLRILSEVFLTLVKAKEAHLDAMLSITPSPDNSLELMDPVLTKLRHILSVLLCISVDTPTPKETNMASLTTFSTLPLPSNWQSEAQRNLSRRVFNLCVGYAVPSSNLAWTSDGEFSLEVMMNTARDSTSNFFGISLSSDETMRAWVCGILPEKVEIELASQLQTLQEEGLVNNAIWDEFSTAFQTIKETNWYSRATEILQRQGGREVLSQGGEEAGMTLLLLLSRSYLTMAKMPDPGDALKKQTVVQTILSIVLPIVSVLNFCCLFYSIVCLSFFPPAPLSKLTHRISTDYHLFTYPHRITRLNSAQTRGCGTQALVHAPSLKRRGENGIDSSILAQPLKGCR